MNQQEIKIWAQNYNTKLLCTDKMFKNCVSVHTTHQTTHPDSYMFYNSAFAIIKDDFYVVFTEHEGCHVLHQYDYVVKMYRNVRIKGIK